MFLFNGVIKCNNGGQPPNCKYEHINSGLLELQKIKHSSKFS